MGKFLVLAACVAVSSAQLVTYPNGAVVPADEPAVAAAKAAHLAAGGAVLPYAGLPYAGYAGYPYAGYPYAGYPYAHAAYPYHPAALVAHPNGAVVPVDEPAVAAAKADHFAAHGVVVPYHALPYAAGVAYADVVAARAEHLAAHASA